MLRTRPTTIPSSDLLECLLHHQLHDTDNYCGEDCSKEDDGETASDQRLSDTDVDTCPTVAHSDAAPAHLDLRISILHMNTTWANIHFFTLFAGDMYRCRCRLEHCAAMVSTDTDA